MKAKYRTYATEANAKRYLGKLANQYPGKQFVILPAPNNSFRFAVALVIDSDNTNVVRYAYCS